MELAGTQWKYDQLHQDAPYHDGTFPDDPEQWSEKRTKEHPYHYLDGVTLWVADTDLDPHDHFLGGAEDCDECREVNGGDEARESRP